MEWRSMTVQSTSGRGDPDPLQVMVTLSPSTTVRLKCVTLMSGRSERQREKGGEREGKRERERQRGNTIEPRHSTLEILTETL